MPVVIYLHGNSSSRLEGLKSCQELLKNNIAPIVISVDDRVKYFEYLKNEDGDGLAKWFLELSNKELERLQSFGYDNNEEQKVEF